MRRILPFEIAVALKDRPKSFQLITLTLFSFSVTVILMGSLMRIAFPAQEDHVLKKAASSNYAGVIAPTAGPLTSVQR